MAVDIVPILGVAAKLCAARGSLCFDDAHLCAHHGVLGKVRERRYRPTKLNGVPVDVETDIEVSFTLPNAAVSS